MPAKAAAYWEQVVIMNDWQKKRFSQQVVSGLFNTVAGKKIAVLGFAFKKDTNDTRESAAIYVCQDLLDEQAHLAIYDPKVSEDQVRLDLNQGEVLEDGRPNDHVLIEQDPYVAAEGAHAVLILTEWDEFRDLDFQRIYDGMHKPAFLFDGRNILDLDALRAIGFTASGIGR